MSKPLCRCPGPIPFGDGGRRAFLQAGRHVAPRNVRDLLATIYHHLDFDYANTMIKDFNGRPTRIVEHGQAIPELIG